MKRVTIKDIAEHLCISISTVSRALANDMHIRKETRERIFQMAKEMGYQRNPLAACLRSGRTNCIGVVVNEMITSYASQVLQGIQSVMHLNGITTLVSNSDNDPAQERRNLQILENSLVDGIIIAHCLDSSNNDEFLRLQQKGIPMVFIDHAPSGIDTVCVGVNSYDKTFFLVDHLVHSGKRKIVHLHGPSQIDDFNDMHKAYREVLAKHRIPYDPTLVMETQISLENGRRIAGRLLEDGVDFDAVFACHDLLAIGVMNRLHDAGLRIPEDVAIAGFSGSHVSKLVYPSLTTVEPRLHDMGETAAALLLEKISHPSIESKKVVVDAEIMLRGSTHPAGIAD